MQRLRMHGAQVIALHEILDEALPVGVPDLLPAVEEVPLCLMIVSDVRLGRRELRSEWLGRAVEIHENEALPDLGAKLRQLTAALLEVRSLGDEWRRKKLAVEPVGPRVVAAHEARRMSRAVHDLVAAVPAHVGEH